MNVFLRELRANAKALLIWSICMLFLIVSGMGKYTAYSGSGGENDIFNNMPKVLKALFGIGSFDVATMKGYFAMMFLYIELTAAIHAVLTGAGIISKEERDKTTEFLMAKPISRNTIITSKLLAGLVNIFVVNIVSSLSSIIIVGVYNKGNDFSGEIVVFMFSMFLVQLIFFSLGAVIGASIKNSKSAVSIATGIMLMAFIISKITDLTEKMDVLNVLSPFKYFSYKRMADGNGLNALVVILSLVIITAFSVSTYVFYQKRDLNV